MSIFGFGTGNGCLSNPTSIAIGLGEGAQADASSGFFSGAFAAGKNARSTVALSIFTVAASVGDAATTSSLASIFGVLGQFGSGTTAMIGGPNLALGITNSGGSSGAAVTGGFNIVVQVGPGSSAAFGGTNLVVGMFNGSGAQPTGATGASGFGNVALQMGPGITSSVGGFNLGVGISPLGTGAQSTTAGIFGSLALNLLTNGDVLAQGALSSAIALAGDSSVQMSGILSAAVDVLGNKNVVKADGPRLLAGAFSLLGNHNSVTAGPGPFSFAGSVLQTDATVDQQGPGIAMGAVFTPGGGPPEETIDPGVEFADGTTASASSPELKRGFVTAKPAAAITGGPELTVNGVTSGADSEEPTGRHAARTASSTEGSGAAASTASPASANTGSGVQGGSSAGAGSDTAAGVSAGPSGGGKHRAEP